MKGFIYIICFFVGLAESADLRAAEQTSPQQSPKTCPDLTGLYEKIPDESIHKANVFMRSFVKIRQTHCEEVTIEGGENFDFGGFVASSSETAKIFMNKSTEKDATERAYFDTQGALNTTIQKIDLDDHDRSTLKKWQIDPGNNHLSLEITDDLENSSFEEGVQTYQAQYRRVSVTKKDD